jgi:hypothetical protein
MAIFTSVVGGTAIAPLLATDASTWVGGVVPGEGDVAYISAGSFVDIGGETTFALIYVAGYAEIDDISAPVTVEAGGYAEIDGISAPVTVGAGGYAEIAMTYAPVTVEAGGEAIVDDTWSFFIVETDGKLTVTGLPYQASSYYAGATVIGITSPTYIPIYRRTAHQMNNATSAAFGPVTMYAANDPAVAPAASVLEGESNLGTDGALPLARVMQASGGALSPNDVRRDTPTGAAAGGTLDIEPPTQRLSIGL